MKIEVIEIHDCGFGFDKIRITAENRDERLIIERWKETEAKVFAQPTTQSADPYQIILERHDRE